MKACKGNVRIVSTYAGSIEVMVPPPTDSTNSLLMKRPVGCEYLTPLGASRSRKAGAMVRDLGFTLDESRVDMVANDSELVEDKGSARVLETTLWYIMIFLDRRRSWPPR